MWPWKLEDEMGSRQTGHVLVSGTRAEGRDTDVGWDEDWDQGWDKGWDGGGSEDRDEAGRVAAAAAAARRGISTARNARPPVQ